MQPGRNQSYPGAAATAVESRVVQKGDRRLIHDSLIENLSLISSYHGTLVEQAAASTETTVTS
jgi:hypothetical protein